MNGAIQHLHHFLPNILINLLLPFGARPKLLYLIRRTFITLSKPTGHVMHQQFNIQQLYVLPTLYLCVLYLYENKQRPVPLTALTDWFL